MFTVTFDDFHSNPCNRYWLYERKSFDPFIAIREQPIEKQLDDTYWLASMYKRELPDSVKEIIERKLGEDYQRSFAVPTVRLGYMNYVKNQYFRYGRFLEGYYIITYKFRWLPISMAARLLVKYRLPIEVIRHMVFWLKIHLNEYQKSFVMNNFIGAKPENLAEIYQILKGCEEHGKLFTTAVINNSPFQKNA